MGIEKLVPTWADLEVFLQLLPRSSTGERMNPYTSMWSGAVDGQEFHLVLLDNGRTAVLADPDGRAALRCIRCSACLNVCPVYERTGGHAYGSVYPGPIGAVLSPQLTGPGFNATLPYASSLCGACYDACPVAIDIPSMLVHLRAQVPHPAPERAVMRSVAYAMGTPRRWAGALAASRAGRLLGRRRGRISTLPPPLSGWTTSRDLPLPPAESFRTWWTRTHTPPATPGATALPADAVPPGTAPASTAGSRRPAESSATAGGDRPSAAGSGSAVPPGTAPAAGKTGAAGTPESEGLPDSTEPGGDAAPGSGGGGQAVDGEAER
jgi:L-lactate dehydrogenase complex protein LldF